VPKIPHVKKIKWTPEEKARPFLASKIRHRKSLSLT
jgi:hypothetical protein